MIELSIGKYNKREIKMVKERRKPKKGDLISKVIHQVNLFFSSPVIQRNWKFSFGVLVHG